MTKIHQQDFTQPETDLRYGFEQTSKIRHSYWLSKSRLARAVLPIILMATAGLGTGVAEATESNYPSTTTPAENPYAQTDIVRREAGHPTWFAPDVAVGSICTSNTTSLSAFVVLSPESLSQKVSVLVKVAGEVDFSPQPIFEVHDPYDGILDLAANTTLTPANPIASYITPPNMGNPNFTLPRDVKIVRENESGKTESTYHIDGILAKNKGRECVLVKDPALVDPADLMVNTPRGIASARAAEKAYADALEKGKIYDYLRYTGVIFEALLKGNKPSNTAKKPIAKKTILTKRKNKTKRSLSKQSPT